MNFCATEEMMINFSIEQFTEGLNAEQKKAVENPINSCTKIVAGAGTGKTKIISKRFVKLVFDLMKTGVEDAPQRLLVITFTDKAAGEMKSRIVKELDENGIEANDLWVSTFHSFCSRILKKHSIEAGLSPAFKMGEEQELEKIYSNIIKRIKYNEYKTIDNITTIAAELGVEPDILSAHNLKILNKIDNLDTIFDEIYFVIKKIKSLGLEPEEFLDKALRSTSDFSKTLETLSFGFTDKDSYINSWEEHLKPYSDSFCKFEDIKTDAKGKNSDKGAFSAIASAKLILDKNGKAKAENWGYASGFPECLEKIAPYERYLAQVIALIYAVYCKELENADLIDFDDLINKTIYIFKHNELLRTYYSKYFKHLIIDEFQDTNGSQLELIKLLLSPDDADITFVGDRKQSIYGFRFAQMENLEVLHKYIEQKYGKKYEEIRLKTNYRSTNYVLDAVNYVTEEHLQLDEALEAFKKADGENKYVKYTEFCNAADRNEHKIAEAQYIAQEILKLKEQDKANFKDFAVLVKSHAQAELVEKYLAKSGIPSVKKVNTGFFNEPVIKNAIALLRYFSDATDEIALIRIFKIKLSDAQVYRLKLSLDKKILETKEFDELKRMNFCDKLRFVLLNSETDLTDLEEQTKNYVKQIFETMNAVKLKRKSFSLLQCYYKLINSIQPYVPSTQTENRLSERNLRVFEKILSDYIESDNYVSAKNFLDYIEKIKEDRNFEFPSIASSTPDAVQLLTIHASKGLEFPYVFVLSLLSNPSKQDTNINFDFQYGNKPGHGILIRKFEGNPTAKALVYNEIWRKPREKNEALRLFYVAVSRAEKYLNVLTGDASTIADYTKFFPSPVFSQQIDISNKD